MTIQHITELKEFQTLIKSTPYVAVDFTATWCGPCKMIGPIFDKLSTDEKHTKWTFCKIDVDDAEDIASEYEITAMPTFIFIKDGVVVDKFSGANSKMLETKLNDL
jgi:thioredoxin 1